MRTFSLLVAAISLGACTGTLTTTQLANPVGNEPVDGVIVYMPTYVRAIYETTTLVDGNGNLTGTAAQGKCAGVTSSKLELRADLSRPYRISYKPGLLESHSLGLTLSDGMLQSLNLESTPDKGETLANVSTAVAGFAGVMTAAPGGVAACNDGLMLVRLERVPFPD